MKKMKPNTVIIEDGYGHKHYVDTRNMLTRRRWWTKSRVPGTVRKTRMPGGSGFRGHKTYEGAGHVR